MTQKNNKITELLLSDEDEGKKKSFHFDFSENKFIMYFGLFYLFGLFLGSYFYKLAQSETLNDLVMIKNGTFINLFIGNFLVCFSVFLVVTFLGFCLISYPIINTVPVIIGIVTGMRLAYYYVNYGAKGVGYSLLMIVPYTALFVTAVAFTMKVSTELSIQIKNAAKGDCNPEFDIKIYVKKYICLAGVVAASVLINTGLTKLLFEVVTI